MENIVLEVDKKKKRKIVRQYRREGAVLLVLFLIGKATLLGTLVSAVYLFCLEMIKATILSIILGGLAAFVIYFCRRFISELLHESKIDEKICISNGMLLYQSRSRYGSFPGFYDLVIIYLNKEVAVSRDKKTSLVQITGDVIDMGMVPASIYDDSIEIDFNRFEKTTVEIYDYYRSDLYKTIEENKIMACFRVIDGGVN